MRKTTSMTMLISLVLLLLNSVVLYFVPEGRVAHWADWHFLGLSKTDWGNQHLTVGTLFLLAGFLHIYYNWRAIVSYLKNRMKAVRIFTPSFNIGLLITLFVAVGSYFNLPPMSTLVDFSVYLKQQGANKHGVPPYGHAELSSLQNFCQKENLLLDQALLLLNQAGIQVESSDQPLADIAKVNGISPQQIYQVIIPAKKEGDNLSSIADGLPAEPPQGFGKKTLEQICGEYGLVYDAVADALRDKGLRIEAGASIRMIADQNSLEPADIYQVMRTVVPGE